MNTALLVLILALLWAGTTGSFSGLNLLFGGLLGLGAAFLLRDSLSSRRGLRRMGRIVRLLGLFLYELMASAVRVALVVIRPDIKNVVRPAIVAVPLSVTSDAEITLLANLITLTPGTLSIDVSPDRKHLYVHALTMDDREALIADIVNGFEKQVKAVFE